MPRSREELEELARTNPDAFEAAAREYARYAFIPHSGGQKDVMASGARFRTLAAGRRWGKTKLAAHEIVRRSVKPNQTIWWVANTYKNVRRGYKEVVRQMPASWLAKPAPSWTSNELHLTLKNGTIIEFYSGGSPDALAGEGVDFLVVDEGALIPDPVWQQLLRPTLMDTGGDALIISTPRGHNWFWEMWKRGNENRPNYQSWQLDQTMNPYIPIEETMAAKEELPKIIFEQEIMARFLAAGASIFGEGLNTEGALVGEIVEATGNIFVGVDLAKKADFTVISASREIDRLPVHFEKFNDLAWPVQQRRIKAACDDLEQQPGVEGVTVLIDSTGLGDVVYDNLTEEGLDCIPIVINNAWKEASAKLLAADLESGKAHILSEMVGEFEAYEMNLSPAGNMIFEAGSGHDDEVIAKSLEHWGVVHEGSPEIAIVDLNTTPTEDQRNQKLLTEIEPDSIEDIMSRPGVWT